MRIVFLGTPEAALPSFAALLEAGHDVRLAVTRPDRPVGRSRRPAPPAVKRAAEAAGVEVFQPTRVRDDSFLERLRAAAPDLLVVVAYGRILTGATLQLAPFGAINLHFSLLPRYRGAAPVQWALARGERITGVTTMEMSEGLDEGDLLLQRPIEIGADEHAPELGLRLAEFGAQLLIETIDGLARDSIRAVAQLHADATFAPPLSREDGEVSPTEPAASLIGRIRGFDPWPGVWVALGELRIRLLEAAVLAGESAQREPGTIEALDGDGLVVSCGEGTCMRVTRLQVEGRAPIGGRDAVNGRVVRVGDRFTRLSRDG